MGILANSGEVDHAQKRLTVQLDRAGKTFRVCVVRPITEDNLKSLQEMGFGDQTLAQIKAWDLAAEEEEVQGVMRVLDMFLEPDDAETAQHNLLISYSRRRKNRFHARRWLWAQAGWIILNRGIDLMGRVRRAWVGK